MQVTIRKAKAGDEEILAYIQTSSWKTAFADILDAEVLSKLTDFDRTVNMYRRVLSANNLNGYILSFDEKPHCIAYWGDARDEENRGKAELICIHSLPENWHKGYGSKMMEVVLEDIRNTAEYREVVLWVFKDNTRAREFYESKGFEPTSISRKTYDTEEMLYTMKIG